MAEGAWIPVFDSIWTHRKTARLAKELNVPIEVAAAKFLRLCGWARDACDSGDVGTVEHAVLAKAVGLPERFGGRLFGALQAAELVTRDTRGHIIGWEEGPGRLVERRRKERERKADWRANEARLKGERQANEARVEAERALRHQTDTDAAARRRRASEAVHIGGGTQSVPRDVPGDVRTQSTESRREETYRSGRGSLSLAGDGVRGACRRGSCGHPWFAHRGPGDPTFSGVRECAASDCLCPEYVEFATPGSSSTSPSAGAPTTATGAHAGATERQPDAEPPILEPERDADTPYSRVREASR